MKRRRYVIGAVATVALTAASLVAVAAAQPDGSRIGSPPPMHGSAAGAGCPVPSPLPGEQVTVMLADMIMGRSMMGRSSAGGLLPGTMMLRSSPTTVAPGTVSLVALNRGTRTHELVVLPLAGNAPVGTRVVGADNTVDETGSLGEASKPCGAGAGGGITRGAAGWVSLTLTPGRYELLCNLPGHYAAGMYGELDVRG